MPWSERIAQTLDALSYFGGLLAVVSVVGYGVHRWVDKGLMRDTERFEEKDQH